jgi:rubrerythrin
LEGQDPDIEQLLAKIKILEDRLDKKREQLLEKELVLEEITSLTEKLRTQAVTKREAAKVLADDLNDLHGKIRDITKKMLASVSELSMYQATALRLQQEKLQRSKAVDEAKWRLTHGEAPTDQAETMLKRSERQETMHQEMLQRRAMELPLLGAVPGQFLRTAAEPRPTAYIPDDLGIPRPYGNLAPFKPSEPGASMRHIRQPQIKPIEI